LETLGRYLKPFLDKITPAVVFPLITVFFLAFFFLYYRRIQQPLPGTFEWVEKRIVKNRLTFMTARYPMEKTDIIPLVAITAAFAFLALFRLGDMEAPQSFFRFTHEKPQVVIELHSPGEISSMMFYTGLWTGHYMLEFSEDGVVWHEQQSSSGNSNESSDPAMNQQYSLLFKWRHAELNSDNPPVKYIRLTASRIPMELGEIVLYASDGTPISRYNISCPEALELFDEQELAPERPTFMNSMYFDEVYHGRTGYEFTRGLTPSEATHPPLGKEMIAASILAFGMTPFGWRFIGAVVGVIMLIVLYIFVKNLFGKTAVAICGTLLFGFDFMRFTQTRIATIDTYGVFFILLAYFFMYRHITADAQAPLRKSIIPLALSGISFGLGCAAKWNVIYAGLGLAVIYVIRLILLARHYKREEWPGFRKLLVKTLLFSVLFFAVIPVIIYCLSYIPHGYSKGMTIGGGMLWDRRFYEFIWKNQVSMFEFHSGLDAVHPYSSQWWQWILDALPILYVNSSHAGLRSSIVAFGNPVVWWGGFVAVVSLAFRSVKHRDGKALFILIGYLSQFLPWVAVTRVLFIYHYLPSTLFLVLALAYVLDKILDRKRGMYKFAAYGYTAASGAVFAMFYPALTGAPAPHWYFANILRWIPEVWPF